MPLIICKKTISNTKQSMHFLLTWYCFTSWHKSQVKQVCDDDGGLGMFTWISARCIHTSSTSHRPFKSLFSKIILLIRLLSWRIEVVTPPWMNGLILYTSALHLRFSCCVSYSHFKCCKICGTRNTFLSAFCYSFLGSFTRSATANSTFNVLTI